MKKRLMILVVVGLAGLAATACAPRRSNRAAFTMQPITELAVGTLKLDGTAEAVTKEEAATLLPMWEVYKQIVSSDTAAQQEIDGLSEQIRQAMTDAQQQSITSMKLGERDVFAVMQQGQGGASGPVARTNGASGSSRSNGSSQQGGARQGGNTFFFGGGGGPEGGGFAPGGGFPGGGTNSPSSQGGSAAQAATQRLTQSARPQVPGPVLNALIAYLKAKAAG